MSEPFLGEIVAFAGNFAPRGWAFCDGQLLAISQNTALFSILGTTYGGDGRTTFALPDLRGRVPMHPGNGPGLSSRRLGEKGGSESNRISTANLPAITRPVSSLPADQTDPSNAVPAESETPAYTRRTANASSASSSSPNTPVNNVQPFTCVNYIIALQGIFPSRN